MPLASRWRGKIVGPMTARWDLQQEVELPFLQIGATEIAVSCGRGLLSGGMFLGPQGGGEKPLCSWQFLLDAVFARRGFCWM